MWGLSPSIFLILCARTTQVVAVTPHQSYSGRPPRYLLLCGCWGQCHYGIAEIRMIGNGLATVSGHKAALFVDVFAASIACYQQQVLSNPRPPSPFFAILPTLPLDTKKNTFDCEPSIPMK